MILGRQDQGQHGSSMRKILLDRAIAG
jgi:hypothetical protein